MIEQKALPCQPAADIPALEARRYRAAFVAVRACLKQAVQAGGPNVKMHVGDMLRILDAFADGTLDNQLDEGENAVTGPFYNFPPSVQ